MGNSNAFLPFATGTGANVESDASWAADSNRTVGFQSGRAPSATFNKAWRQSAAVAAAVGQFAADFGPSNVVDDGNTANLEGQIRTAVSAAAWIGTFGGTANALTATFGPTIEAPALVAGMTVTGLIAATNTGAVTLNLNGLGAAAVTRVSGSAMTGGELVTGGAATFCYSGSAWVLVSMLPMSFFATPTRIIPVTSTTTLTFAANETRARIKGNGPGAGGGGSFGTAGVGVGGGAAAYIDAYITNQAAGNTLAFSVGAVGIGGNGTPAAGGNGGTTTITGTGVSITLNSPTGGGPGNNTVGTTGGTGGSVTYSGANVQMIEALHGEVGFLGLIGGGPSYIGGTGASSPRSGGLAQGNSGTAGTGSTAPGGGGNGGASGGGGGNGGPASFVVEFLP